MEHGQVKPQTRRNLLPGHGSPVGHEEQPALPVSRRRGDQGQASGQAPSIHQAAIGESVDVITVCESWWCTRARLGVHVLNPSDSKLDHAKHVAWLAGTNTVYVYKKLGF